MWGRPPGVVLLAIGFLYLTAVSLTRWIAAIKTWDILHALYPAGAPEYLLVSGILFCAASLGLAGGLWQGKRWAWKCAFFFIPIYIIIGWLERGAMAVHYGWPADWLYVLLANLLVTLIAFGLLFHRSTRRYILGEDIHE